MTPGTPQHQNDREQGIALLSALLVMLLMAGVTAGFTALVITDTRVRMLDSTRTQSFYAVHAGLEQLTADLGDLFAANVAPTAAQINAIAAAPPAVGVTWENPDGSNGYEITFPTDAGGNPLASIMTVQNGPFQGLVGLATPYQMSATGRLRDGSESSLTRTLQTVAIPVFQFGIFSENDLSFFAGPPFNFGGRVHSNANVFLASDDDGGGAGNGLFLANRVTAVGEVVRTHLSNGFQATGNAYTGLVRAITSPGTFRLLAADEGSVVGDEDSADNPNWENVSTGLYNSNIMNGRTGARRLDLPIAMFGDGPIDLIKRPAVGENIANPNLLNERFFTLASLRILLSDTAADITNLPGVTGTAPIKLNWKQDANLAVNEPPVGYTASGDSAAQPRPRFGQTSGANILVPQDTPVMGGFIKIEKQTTPGTWVDVTAEILSLGINSPQLFSADEGAMTYSNAAAGAIACRDWTPNAILRMQRPWDNAGACYTRAEALDNSNTGARRYSPLALYDTREALVRDTAPASMQLGGIMHFVELDARNLARWFRGQIPAANCPVACSGADALNVNGYTVYFSDRRGNRNAANQETGEYGFEDVVNAGAAGTPNDTLDTGEDLNGNGVLDLYGRTARLPKGVTAWASMVAPLTAAATPFNPVGGANATVTIERARKNPPIFFRRALKLTRGADLVAAAPGLQGLTVASENPVYVQGDWNATGGTFNGAHVATAVLADAVTLLSNSWNDRASFASPHAPGGRVGTTTWFRLAIISGKGLSFPRPGGTGNDFGTDGGAHNFLRFLESWSGTPGGTFLQYRGSIASLFTSRQAVGTYKCCATVYGPPNRGYNFDTEFLTPALLPPRTPMFRDVNITGFAQIIRP
jgi:hypothetical protein